MFSTICFGTSMCAQTAYTNLNTKLLFNSLKKTNNKFKDHKVANRVVKQSSRTCRVAKRMKSILKWTKPRKMAISIVLLSKAVSQIWWLADSLTPMSKALGKRWQHHNEKKKTPTKTMTMTTTKITKPLIVQRRFLSASQMSLLRKTPLLGASSSRISSMPRLTESPTSF